MSGFRGAFRSGRRPSSFTVRRTADSDAKTNATLANDDTLKWTVAANETWWFEGYILISGANATHDVKFHWSLPSGATMTWGTLGGLMNEVAAWGGRLATSSPSAMLTESGDLVNGTAAVTSATAFGGILVVSTTAGTANLQWAQQNTDAGELKVLKNSFLRLTRLA